MNSRNSLVCFLMTAVAMAVWPGILFADAKKEDPVGVVLIATGSKLLRAGTETALTAKAGDILFTGDGLKSENGAATFLYCPQSSSASLAPGGEILFEANQLKLKAGKLSDQKKVASCFLPKLVRVAAASQQHYGVSITRGLNKPEPPPAVPPEKLDAAVRGQLENFDKALNADPKDYGALVGRAVVFENHDLQANALAEYKKVAVAWPDAVWVKGRIFELEEALASAVPAMPTDARTLAVLVGISKYQKLPQDLWLQYANADAATFAKHLESPRGGSVPADNILLLTDEKATTAALRNAFETFLKGRAGKKDTVIMLIAGHGTVQTPGNNGAYIVTYDSDPQDLESTALPMADIQKLIQDELSKVGRAAIFVDVCRAGNIGSIKSTLVNAAVERLGEAEGELLGLMASRPKELSYEGQQFGGGHGAFSYFVLKALEGGADADKDGKVTSGEVIDYVREKVAAATNNKQHPRDFGTMGNAVPLADTTKPGIDLARWQTYRGKDGEPVLFASLSLPATGLPGAASPLPPPDPQELDRFNSAIEAGRLLPDSPDSAFTELRALQRRLSPEPYLRAENQLRVALEDRAQQVLLRYLTGDQVPQVQNDFTMGFQYLQAAVLLTPESLYLEGRKDFFRGRAMLFDRNYARAADLLEHSIRVDPAGAYAYNALGIAYLEQADFQRAVPAFRDAIRRAPQWAYPLHNLALANTETGNYNSAILSYQQAMRLTPQYSYLPYNLGLVYQRLNRRKDAERAYHKASSLSPDSAEPYNALGSLKDAMGKFGEAEALYRKALEKNPHFLAARQNLGLLLWGRKERQSEAITLWRANLSQSSDYLPSRLSLADALARQGDGKGAMQEYYAILKLKPEYVAAHVAMADLLVKTKDYEAALQQLHEALAQEKQSSDILERIGDVELALQRRAEAKAAYESALKLAPDGSARKRLRAKLRQ